MGHIISPDGHRPAAPLVQRIAEHKTPSSIRELKSFLGLINYYRDFIQDFSKIAFPLYNLTSKEALGMR